MHDLFDAAGGLDFTPPPSMLGFNRLIVWTCICLAVVVARLGVKLLDRDDAVRIFIEGGTVRVLGAFATPADEPSAQPHPEAVVP